MNDAPEFRCKRCGLSKPADQQVVARYPTRTCRACWGNLIAKGHRVGTDVPADACLHCGKNPRTKGWGVCKPCEKRYRANQRKRANRQVLIPRETSGPEGGEPTNVV